ncbi:invasin domain 3-containing protein [Paenibacillus sp. UNC451MF]|uniref:invasin domain 3-containing protein n=1 Tax=Paenibacillus sp. UNC451MF TaxID=1449063 RepID=UPI00048A8FBF|nr:invasin domain 3-containing protein [Paenibacillus sp. UNC451MF]
MKNLKRRWTAVMLIVTVIFGLFPIGNVFAASDVLDQQQTNGSGNTWVNSTYPKYQTFTPAISGNLSRFELNSAGSYGATGAMLLSLYKESDLSTPLASTQLTSFGSGWVSVDFTGIAPYLKRNMEYRMIVSTEYGGSAGFGWYMTGGDPYPRGTSPSIGYDFAFRTYMIPDYSLSPAESKVTTAQSSLEADGTSQTMVSVQLNDAQGNAITSGGAAVAITSTLGTVSPVTDNNNGTYTATLTAPATVGTATVSASVGGSPIASTATVQFVPGAPSAANSTLTVGGTSLTANGTSQTSIIVKLKDMHGNSLTKGGAAVAITSTLGTVGTVTDDNNGTYTAMLTAPTTVGTATVSANIGGSAIASTAKVQFVPGVASTARSTVTVGNASLTADGTSRTTVTVTLKDAQGNALTVGGSSVAITTTLGTVGPVTDNNNGTYTAMLTAPMIVGTATVSASIGGSAIASTVTVQFVPGVASTSRSTVVVGNATLTADGVSQTTVTVKLNDAQGNALTVGGATVAITTTLGTVGPVTDNNNGTYTATLTAPSTVGIATVGASVYGSELASTTAIQFLPGEVSAVHSTVTASDLVIRADGISKASIFVKLKDDYDHPLAGKRVSLQASGGHSVMADVYGWTDSMGLAAFSVSNTTAESVTFFAKEEQSGQSLHQNVTIKFTYNQPPTITLQANPFLPTFGNVTVSVATSVYGQFNRVSSIKWAAGSHPLSYFETQGMEIADYFTVQKNGVYSVYVADTAGNANIGFIDIQNIVPLSNNASLSNWQLAGLGGTVPFDEFDPGTTSYSVLVSPAVYGLTMKLIPSDVYSVVYVNGGQVANSVITNAYSLVTGKNTFEVNVKAQDGSLKTYTLDVIRASASSGSHSGSGTVSSSTDSSPDNAVSIWINDQKLSGHASVRMEANGTKSIDVRLDTDTVIKVIDSFTTTTERSISIMVDDEAGKIALQLSGEAAALLAQKGAALTLKTQQAQYRLPLAEVVNGISAWSKDTGVQITIERGKLNEIPELQDAARKGDFQWMTDPVHFHVYVLRQSESIEVSNFKHYVERVIYLPKGLDRTASTVVAWDQMHGVRPVPTAFMSIDGREAAVIRSLTNSTYGLVSKASSLTDIQGHWAAAEIVDLNKRLIVNGIDEKRFVPDSVITRAELAALLTRALGLPKGSGHAGFRDVSDSSWYSDSIAAVKANGLMDGFQDGTFGPNQEVSRQEAVVTIIRAMQLAGATSEASRARVKTDLSEYVDRNQIGDWASAAIQTGIHEGLVEGYGNELRPLKSLTRAETVVLIYRLLLKANFINK